MKSVIKTFDEKQIQPARETEKEKEEKQFVLIKIPYCEKNEKIARNFIGKIRELTQNKLNFNILWQSKKIKTLFKIKDEILYKANVIYRGKSVMKPDEVSYIGETAGISELRWNQHEDPKHDSAPSKYLKENPEDSFTWEILTTSSANWLKRKIHEALFIRKYKPSLNVQVKHKKLALFRNGVT